MNYIYHIISMSMKIFGGLIKIHPVTLSLFNLLSAAALEVRFHVIDHLNTIVFAAGDRMMP